MTQKLELIGEVSGVCPTISLNVPRYATQIDDLHKNSLDPIQQLILHDKLQTTRDFSRLLEKFNILGLSTFGKVFSKNMRSEVYEILEKNISSFTVINGCSCFFSQGPTATIAAMIITINSDHLFFAGVTTDMFAVGPGIEAIMRLESDVKPSDIKKIDITEDSLPLLETIFPGSTGVRYCFMTGFDGKAFNTEELQATHLALENELREKHGILSRCLVKTSNGYIEHYPASYLSGRVEFKLIAFDPSLSLTETEPLEECLAALSEALDGRYKEYLEEMKKYDAMNFLQKFMFKLRKQFQ